MTTATTTPKKVLMVAHVFPPFRSVGHSIRVVKFVKYLPFFGWQPAVLTIDDGKEYEDYLKEGSESLLSEISPDIHIHRANAGEPSLDYLQKEKAFGQRNLLTALIVKILGGSRRWTFRNLALPDKRVVWLPFAVKLGLDVVKAEGVDVIFATCPPHSATMVGAFLKLLTGKPLVLDFRDDWIDTPWHQSMPSITQSVERRLERWVVGIADKVILVTEWSRSSFVKRYPSQPSDKFILIPNGCDLAEFTIEKPKMDAGRNSKFTIMHTGSLNDSNNWTRSPAGLFRALHQILAEQPDVAENIVIAFTGSLPEGHRRLAQELGLSGVVKELGFLPRDEWAQQMNASDLLLVINYDGFSTLIPGKIYEYWAIGGAPILLLGCPGAASDFIEEHNLGFTADPYDMEGIKQTILDVYRQSRTGSPLKIKADGIEAFDRRALTSRLAQVLSLVSPADLKLTA